MGQKCVIYTRYSSDRQREESIEGQIRVCEDYAKRNGLEVLHIYADRAMTGRSDQRPEFLTMIKDATSMTFDTVLVYKLNRFARNRYDSAKYKHKLKKYGVKVVSAMENIADDPSGILLESVIEGMAEYYSAELAENVVRGMTENALEGKWAGGNIPLGYKLDASKHLVIDDISAKTVKKIYRMILDGRQPASIIRELNAEGCRTSKGKKFTRTSLSAILRNEKYSGVYTWHNVRKPGAVPAIVSRGDWEKVQEIIAGRKKHAVRSCSETYLLTGRLFCRHCGSGLVGTSGTSHSSETYRYYICTNHLKKQGCPAKPVRADKLEDLVCAVTTDLLKDKEAIKAIAVQAIEAQKNKDSSLAVQSLKNQIADIEKKLKNCINAVADGLISDAVATRIKEYESSLTELRNAMAKEELLSSGPQLTEKHIEFFFYSIAQQIKKRISTKTYCSRHSSAA